jgi:hypothetical protein
VQGIEGRVCISWGTTRHTIYQPSTSLSLAMTHFLPSLASAHPAPSAVSSQVYNMHYRRSALKSHHVPRVAGDRASPGCNINSPSTHRLRVLPSASRPSCTGLRRIYALRLGSRAARQLNSPFVSLASHHSSHTVRQTQESFFQGKPAAFATPFPSLYSLSGDHVIVRSSVLHDVFGETTTLSTIETSRLEGI